MSTRADSGWQSFPVWPSDWCPLDHLLIPLAATRPQATAERGPTAGLCRASRQSQATSPAKSDQLALKFASDRAKPTSGALCCQRRRFEVVFSRHVGADSVGPWDRRVAIAGNPVEHSVQVATSPRGLLAIQGVGLRAWTPLRHRAPINKMASTSALVAGAGKKRIWYQPLKS
jgi:hypothetical protein